MKKKQVEKEQNNEKQLPRQETTLGEDIFQLLLKKEMEQQKNRILQSALPEKDSLFERLKKIY